ncbi:putative ferredoxin reductase [Kocuria dechangensis]|uniref:Ferredoxin reductase n=1 Tax=Kocuria dechangensis TaxID=1176249 RepID=A0A917LZ44_9MICC|nr:FAD-dependent oxidoreductase [Kocuria dechangensis]GGG65216.1 putative ferredoxin reductase [Kocuria dechangensis]
MTEHTTHPVVVVGSGHAGVAVAAGLRTRGWAGRVVLVDAQHDVPYERPPLSKDLLASGAGDRAAPLRKEDWYEAKGIERVTGQAVDSIDRDARAVILSDGSRLPYHRLVLATGSRARELPVPGADLDGVLALRTHQDGLAIKQSLVPGARVVVIGAGFIGMEVAAAAVKNGCAVTVLEFQDRVMKRVTSPPVSAFFERLHRSQGLRLEFGAAVTELQGDGRVERVLTSDGRTFEADVVVAGIGVLPNQELAEAAGLACQDGILVNEQCRTTDPCIYAAGDVTRFTSPFSGASQRLESIQNATAQAEAVVDDVLDHEVKPSEVPWFWTVQHGVRLQTAGVMHPDDEVVVRGDPERGKFSVVYLREGRLAAVDTIGGLADFRPAKKLISTGLLLDPARVADPGVKLEDAVIGTGPRPGAYETAAALV